MPLSLQECYDFSVYDYYGDGLGASQWGGEDGVLNLLDNGGATIYTVSEADFGAEEASVFRNLTLNINVENLSSFSVYPNPAKEYLILVADVNTCSQYKITDLLGKTFSEGPVSVNNTEINTSTLSAGSYLIHVMRNDGTIEYQSIIVK